MNIEAALAEISKKFEVNDLHYGHGTTNAWDEAVFLILTIMDLPLDSDPSIMSMGVPESALKCIRDVAHRRVKERIPMAYLLNKALFAGLEFYVDERVLIPRSPFAELILSGFEPWIGKLDPKRILEIGTGSGCMAIAMAAVFPDAQVDAVDISQDAIEVAQKNITDYHAQERVHLIESDLFANVDGKYDLIISNPPYVDKADMDDRPEEFHHEPDMALESGDDGLNHTRIILENAKKHLNKDGLLFVEVGNSAPALEAAFPTTPFTWIELEEGGHGIFCLTELECTA